MPKTSSATRMQAIATPFSDLLASITGSKGDDRITPTDPLGGPNSTEGADRIQALAGNDYVDGAGGDDRIDGGNGDDTVFGGLGNDKLSTGAGNDAADGGDGNDTMIGGAGDDNGFVYDDQTGTYFSGLSGGAGNDSIDGGLGNDALSGGAGVDTLIGGDGDDQIDATIFYGPDDGDVVHAGDGADAITAGQGDTVYAEAGDDHVYLPSPWDSGASGYVDGGDGNDQITGSSLTEGSQWFGGSGADTLSGSSAWAVRLDGGQGDDVISFAGALGASGASLAGGEGADQITALSGTVSVDAGDGADLVTLGQEFFYDNSLQATVSLGDGIDTVQALGTTLRGGNTATVTDFQAGPGGDKLDVFGLLSGIIRYDGSHPFLGGWMRLVADGNDTLLQVDADGSAGSGGWITSVRLQGVDLATLTNDNLTGGLTLSGDLTPRDLAGGEGDDSLLGADGNDTLSGLGGNDLLDAGYGGGDSVLGGDGSDTVLGGAGNDLLLGEAGDDAVLGGSDNDSIYGGDGNDNVFASVERNGYWTTGNGLSGGEGDDLIDGGAGDDLLTGGTGSDTLYGGDGNDSLYANEAAPGDIDLVHGGQGDDVIHATGQSSLYGEAGADQLVLSSFGGLADGGLGNDSFVIDNYGGAQSTGATLLGGGGRDTFQGWSGADINLQAGDGDDQITLYGYAGGVSNWTINGGAGDDQIDLAGSGHTVLGGDGNDTISADSSYGSDSIFRVTTGRGVDTITPNTSLESDWYGPSVRHEIVVTDFQAGAGGDRIDLSRINAALGLADDADPFNTGRLRLTASGSQTLLEIDADGSGSHFVTVLALQQTTPGALTADNFVQQVNAVISNNAALPRVDADKVITLAEDSIVALDLSRPTDPDGGTLSIMVVQTPYGRLTLKDGSEVYSGQLLSPAELASLHYQPYTNQTSDPGNFRYSVTDDEGSTVMRDVSFQITPVPDAPVVRVYGDTSYVDSEAVPFSLDVSYGTIDPDGQSSLSYSLTADGGQALPDWLSFDPDTKLLTGTAPYGTQQTWTIEVTVTDPDGLVGSTTFELRPAEYAFIYGTAAAETLLGSSGDDNISGMGGDDWLDGRAGAASLSGGAGNDTYVLHGTGDVAFEYSGEGTDTVRAETDFTLGNNLENLVLLGSATNATGNTLDNHLTGNALANTLTGNAGYDTLAGAGGNDQLRGGEGGDWFVFEASAGANGRDTILDLQVGVGRDVIDVSAFLGAKGGSTLDGDTAHGDAFDVFTDPATIHGQHVLALEDALGGQAPGGGDLAALLEGFQFDNGSQQVFVVQDTDTGQGYIAFGADRAGDGNNTMEAAELKLVATLNFAPGQDFDGLDSGNFATRAQLALDLQANASLSHHAFEANLLRAASDLA